MNLIEEIKIKVNKHEIITDKIFINHDNIIFVLSETNTI